MRLSILAAFFSLSLVSARGASSPSPGEVERKVLSWSELSHMPLPPPGERVAYGPRPQQFGELRVPPGEGPFPLMIVIHGGCWQSEFDYVYMTRLAAWLTAHGVATWTIEYRRLGDDGGGWPGTFLDVANAADALRKVSVKSHLDLNRVYAAGHSAGGQLALWLASRPKLSPSSELYAKDAIPIHGVLGLAAITDLVSYRIGPPDSCHSSVDQLLGGSPETVPGRFADTSPLMRLPLGTRQVFVQGERDPIVDPVSVRAYVAAAKKEGDDVTLLSLPTAGHFESSTPLAANEAEFEQALKVLLAPGP